MIHLNILSSKEKKLYKQAILERLVNYYVFVVLGVIIFLVLGVFGAKYFLIWRVSSFEANIAAQKTEEITEKIEAVEENINQINGMLVSIRNINSQNFGLVEILDNLSSIALPGIYFEDLSYKFVDETMAGKFVLAGSAGKREDLIEFLWALEQSPYFKEIESPLSNLIKKENLNFQITFKSEITLLVY